MKTIGNNKNKGYKWTESDIVTTRVIDEINRTLRLQGLQVRWSEYKDHKSN